MQTEQLRNLLLEWLRNAGRRTGLQYQQCVTGVGQLAGSRFPEEVDGGRQDGLMRYAPTLRGHDSNKLLHVIWDLILERILVPGNGDSGWPFLSITEFGEQVIAEVKPVPYDPDRYLQHLANDAPGIHSTVVRYTEEALRTFKTGNYLASVVMLGAASEKMLNELSAALPETVADPVKSENFRNSMNRGQMAKRLRAIIGWCRNHRDRLPPPWNGEEQADDINNVANLIRKNRNDAGHPQDPPKAPNHEQMYSYLVCFPSYCRDLYQLKGWADSNPGAIA